ncbi:MAG: hypothetical protein H0X49_03460 [Acidobacteria bacterium]|jgi:hypothetical protein|nr:hypothetical protein [Acidobacteriota bacterium]
MMQTVEAEINVDGTVTLLEPVRVNVKTKALVTVLENGGDSGKENVSSVLELMQSDEFKNRRSYPAEQIEANIEEARNSWE